ncbi:ATP-binding cassette domain-containing protein [Nocardioides sp. REDSEA-S30_B4]|jgi:branched-chain amino acid transport system ATP-binding protein|uniref:ABC transporter ATP-binding protein n=1 Tax=Nocardioides sp. REDSEA-S30_B4 TaxID=1811552 RepID=UPI000A7C4132|nr:ATP-binding cassette domain-containing protein [Nocardioides sp. REDSEA-S30_B4]
MNELLSVDNLQAGYGDHPVVRDLCLQVHAGEVVALLGPNGAGKSTTLLTLAGDLSPIAGVVRMFGADSTDPLHRRARRGMALVTEERSVLMGLTVAENLRLGRCDVARAIALFPELERLMNRRCGLLSGGEQQIVTLARAIAREPRLLLADELSLGLAPLVVRRLLETVRQAADEDGIGALLVEQHVSQVLRIADRAYVMDRGRIVFSGDPADVARHIGTTGMSSSHGAQQ